LRFGDFSQGIGQAGEEMPARLKKKRFRMKGGRMPSKVGVLPSPTMSIFSFNIVIKADAR